MAAYSLDHFNPKSDLRCCIVTPLYDILLGSQGQLDITARGKRSIALNLKSAEGQDVLRTLAKTSDVLIEPFRKGEKAKCQKYCLNKLS